MKSERRQGRPTKQEQTEIRRTLHPYYQKSISATATSKKTGINIKTVLKYFDEWDKKLVGVEEKDFLKRCRITKERGIQTLDEEILSLNHEEKEIDSIKQVLRKTGDVLHFERLSRLQLKIKDLKTKLLVAKINLINTPTADTIIHLDERGNENDSV